MKLVIFSGTTEGRELSVKLAAAGAEVTVCVATEYGSEEQGSFPGVATLVGPLSPEEKQRLLRDAALCVDATHPYAAHISASVRSACEAAKVPYVRLRRASVPADGAIVMKDAAAAAEWLRAREGNILLTTGAKELPAFRDLPGERLFPRVLPTVAGVTACEACGIPHRNIIAMQGPFTEEMNIATIRQYDIRYLVTKDGGIPGGFPEKIRAAKETGTCLVVLQRPEEIGLAADEVFNLCMTALRR